MPHLRDHLVLGHLSQQLVVDGLVEQDQVVHLLLVLRACRAWRGRMLRGRGKASKQARLPAAARTFPFDLQRPTTLAAAAGRHGSGVRTVCVCGAGDACMGRKAGSLPPPAAACTHAPLLPRRRGRGNPPCEQQQGGGRGGRVGEAVHACNGWRGCSHHPHFLRCGCSRGRAWAGPGGRGSGLARCAWAWRVAAGGLALAEALLPASTRTTATHLALQVGEGRQGRGVSAWARGGARAAMRRAHAAMHARVHARVPHLAAVGRSQRLGLLRLLRTHAQRGASRA